MLTLVLFPTKGSTVYRRPPAPASFLTVFSAAILSRAAPESSAPSPLYISMSLVRSKRGFLSTLTLRIKVFCRGKILLHFFSISAPMASGYEILVIKDWKRDRSESAGQMRG